MPNHKKQKLSKEEKARRKLKSHTTGEAFNGPWWLPEWNKGNPRTPHAYNNSLMIASIEQNMKPTSNLLL